MSASLNNVQAPDEYEEAIEVRATGAAELFLSVSNQAIYYQLGHGIGGGSISWDEDERFRPPAVYNIDVECDAVRFRAAVPAAELPAPLKPAQVTATLA